MKYFTFLLLFSFSVIAGCIKDETGSVRFRNTSTNPYKLSINGESKGEFGGGTSRIIDLDAGSYTLKAEQVSGFILYPTIKTGQISVSGGDILEWSFP